MTSNLRLRNGHYYFRLRIPTDLNNILHEPEILKSLRTKDRKAARIAASSMFPGFLQVFTLSRTRFITPGTGNRAPEWPPEPHTEGESTAQNRKPAEAPSPPTS